MIAGLWGRKVGMTQVFSAQKVVPVTVINTADWVITDIKTQERDGYDAIQVGHCKKRFTGEAFSPEWLKKKRHYFSVVREIKQDKPVEGIEVGQLLALDKIFAEGDQIDTTGTSKGFGFAGVVKRYGFAGGRASHGDSTGRKPGSIGTYRTQGRVIKNKKLPGHYGCERKTVSKLKIVSIKPEHQLVLVEGSIPGKPGSLVFMRKRGV